MIKKHYTCPVCGFDRLREPPYGPANEPSYEICRCCGFEFGFDGENSIIIFSEFRQRWIDAGVPWFISTLKPKNWDYQKQLKNIKS